MSDEDAVSLALKEPGWTVNDREKLICPVRKQLPENQTVLAEKQLSTLTDFVSFQRSLHIFTHYSFLLILIDSNNLISF